MKTPPEAAGERGEGPSLSPLQPCSGEGAEDTVSASCADRKTPKKTARVHIDTLPKGNVPLLRAKHPNRVPDHGPAGGKSCETPRRQRGRLKGLSRDVYKRVSPSSGRGTQKRKGFGK